MRDIPEVRELDAFRVDEDQSQLLGGVVEEKASDDGVDADALTAACGACDEEVRHAREVSGYGLARDSLPERNGELQREFALWKAVLSMTLRMATSEVVVLGTSMPTTGLPGTGASMRMVGAVKANARSLARFVMRFTRTRVRDTTSERI